MVSTGVAATFAAAYTLILLFQWRKRVKRLPPGPPKLPLLDNLLNMPENLDAKMFAEMGKDLDSEILHFGTLGTSIVILNSYRVAKELLDRRSGIYSSRPSSTMFNMCGWGFQFTSWPYGESWREARKLFTKWFNVPAVHQPSEEFYVRHLLKQLLDEPNGWYSYLRHVPGSVTLDMTYGIKVHSNNNPYVKLAEEGSQVAGDLFVGGAHLVDILPLLRHLPVWTPGASFQRTAASSRELAQKVVDLPFEGSKELMKTGEYSSSFVTRALEESSSEAEADLAKKVAGAVYLAGSDTTTSALGTFVLSMVLHPDVQRKAQQELDAALNGRLPRHEDLIDLPYLTAVIWEIYRWRPVAPIGVSHSVIMEDIFEGMLIPKDALVAPNQWAMMHDERDFPEPDKFLPERFLKDGQIDPSVRNPMDIGFGFGRRICPGRHIAHNILTLAAASLLSTFNIMKKKDANGNILEPSGEYEGYLISQPLEFPCSFEPRSPHSVSLIRSL